MGVSFHKSKNIVPGVRLNFSKSGISTSIGRKGCRVNFGSHGVRTNFSIPGTGIRFRGYSKYGRGYNSVGSSSNSGSDLKQWGCALLVLVYFFAITTSLAQGNMDPLLCTIGVTMLCGLVYVSVKLIIQAKNSVNWRRHRIEAEKEYIRTAKKQAETVQVVAVQSRRDLRVAEDQRIAQILADVPPIVRADFQKIHQDFIRMIAYISTQEYSSASQISRRFSVGFNVAGRIIIYMQAIDALSKVLDNQGFKVLITPEDVPILLNSVDAVWLKDNIEESIRYDLSQNSGYIKVATDYLQRYPIGQLDNKQFVEDVTNAIIAGRKYINVKKEIYDEVIKLQQR